MKTRLAWMRATAASVLVAGTSLTPAAAQYAPYRPLPQQPAAQQAAPTTTAPAAQTPYTAWQTSQGVAPYRPATQYAPTPATPYTPTAATPYTPAGSQTVTPYVPAAQPAAAPYIAGYPAYPAIARQPNGETMPAPQSPAEQNGYNGYANGHNGPANGPVQNGHVDGGQPVDGQMHLHGAPGGYANGYYPATTGCDSAQRYVDYGVSNYFDTGCHDTQWFGGIYFLFMERDNATPIKLTVDVDHSTMPDPYYPQADRTVLGTHFVDHDYRSGIEVRFGSTFTISEPCDTACGPYGCNSCAPCAVDVYAWEAAWWGIDDDVEEYTFVEEFNYPRRIYGMKNFAGLEYDRDGAGAGWAYRPVNDYYAYALPIDDPGAGPYADGYIRVLAQHVRTNFKAQNLELNIFRFPVCEVASGGCDTGCNTCGEYGAAYGCEPECCPSAFSMYGSCGVRYFRVDDDFMYANEFSEWALGVPDKGAHDGFYDGESNEMYYDVQVDNHLVGAQVGWTMNYNYACKWNFFCNSTFGMFNNHINHMQQMWGGGGGDVRFIHSGEDFYVESEKNDIAFLGELRLGGSYDLSCHWRAVMAYRAIAIAGLATSTDQIPEEFTNPEWVAIIDSDNSMIVHGLQLGAECRY